MLKPSFALLVSLCIALAVSLDASASYQRDQAVPVEKVVYGNLVSVRNITEKQLVEDRNTGWKTFGGALIGGVIGHQFGGGSGQDVATVLGTLLGARVAHRYADSSYYQELHLVELMIIQDGGQQIMVIQNFDPSMVFNVGDEVRVVYLQGRVRVDIAM
ncbi:MAG: glycine zipper 2TM domain-containing protein [Shewanella sp.]